MASRGTVNEYMFPQTYDLLRRMSGLLLIAVSRESGKAVRAPPSPPKGRGKCNLDVVELDVVDFFRTVVETYFWTLWNSRRRKSFSESFWKIFRRCAHVLTYLLTYCWLDCRRPSADENLAELLLLSGIRVVNPSTEDWVVVPAPCRHPISLPDPLVALDNTTRRVSKAVNYQPHVAINAICFRVGGWSCFGVAWYFYFCVFLV